VDPCRADLSILKVINYVFGPSLTGRDALRCPHWSLAQMRMQYTGQMQHIENMGLDTTVE
jgi:hypothetical protein